MGKTSSQAKQKWNNKHYSTIKASVKPQTAAVFKAACAAAGTSMASELANFMETYANPPREKALPPNVKTLGNRRKAMAVIIALMAEMRDAEENYMNNMHENFQSSSRYEEADERLGSLDEALDAVRDIY